MGHLETNLAQGCQETDQEFLSGSYKVTSVLTWCAIHFLENTSFGQKSRAFN